MDKFMESLERTLVPIAERISDNKYLSAISRGFSMEMPVFIIGAIFTLLASLNLGVYQEFIINLGIKNLFLIPTQLTTNIMSIYTAFTIAYQLTQENDLIDDAPIAGLLGILAFLIITPLKTVTISEVSSTMIPMDWLGSQGLFMAIIVGLLTASIYYFVVERKWIIKMPAGVPTMVEKSFASLIPGFVIVLFFLIINLIFAQTAQGNAHEFLYSILKAPLSSLQQSLFAFLFLNFLGSLLWFLGLHGGMITMPFMLMLFLPPGLENMEAAAAGQPLPNILTAGLMGITLLGGVGSTLSLCIIMLKFSKSERYKTLGKLAIAPGVCGINEPIMFGFPLVLNPIMFFPFVIVPIVNTSITYFAIRVGLVGRLKLDQFVFGTPVFLDAFMISGFRAVLLQIALIAIDILIYLPFFKIEDNKAYQEEIANNVCAE